MLWLPAGVPLPVVHLSAAMPKAWTVPMGRRVRVGAVSPARTARRAGLLTKRYSAACFFQRVVAAVSVALASTQRAPCGPLSRFQNGALVLR